MRPSDLADAEALFDIACRLPPLRSERPLSPPRMRALCAELAAQLRAGSWRPQIAERFFIPRGGGRQPRPLVRFALADRIVHRALHAVLDHAHPGFPEGAMAYVRGGGALRVVHWLQQRLATDASHAWSLDVIDFFPSIDHERLLTLLSPLAPAQIVRLTMRAVTTPVQDRAGVERPSRGLAQGSALSPWLSNVYLTGVDRRFAGRDYRRFSDNIYLVGSRARVQRAAAQIAAALAGLALRVRLRPAEPVPARRGLVCLGHHVDQAGRRPTADVLGRFVERLRRRVERGRGEAARALIRGHRAYFGPDSMGYLMTIDDLLRQGRFREALEQMRRVEAASEVPGTGLELGPDETDRLLRVIGGDPERHVRVPGRDAGGSASRREVICQGVDFDAFSAHRRGESEVAAMPVDRMGWAHVVAIDVDPIAGEDADTASDARRLARAARDGGQVALVEATGGRGHHVWVGLERPVPAATATAFVEGIGRMVECPAGIRREMFPAPPDPDPHLTLPLGVHRVTGRRSTLHDVDGTVIESGRALVHALRRPDAVPDEPRVRSAAVQRVLRGCGLLARLARKAVEVRHLAHHERYTLASVLGHLPGGHEAVHGIISWCDNYDAAVTQHFLDRLSPRPMGCTRLGERHPDLVGNCHCPRAGGGLQYASPVRFAQLDREPVARTEQRADDVERLVAGLHRTLARLRREP